jgi:hypothetical protein
MIVTCYGQVKKLDPYGSMGFWVDEAQVLKPWLTGQVQEEVYLFHLSQSQVLQITVKKKRTLIGKTEPHKISFTITPFTFEISFIKLY